MPAIEKIRRRHMMKKKAQRQLLEQLTVELDTEISNLDDDTRLEEGILDDELE